MPELPEVETIKRGLDKLLPGLRIVGEFHDWDKGFPNAPADVSGFLIGAKVLAVKRRAKVLLIELDSDYSLVIHLKMTGQLVFVHKNVVGGRKTEDGSISTATHLVSSTADEIRFGAGHPNHSLIGELPDKSTRVILDLEGQNKHVRDPTSHIRARLFFNDQRKFGWMRLMPTVEVPNIDFFQKVGPEPLAADFLPSDFHLRLLRRSKSNIKSVLLDQTVIAGVGNIYADESLWSAKIHPTTLVANLTPQQMTRLYDALRAVLELSIEKGGSSDKNYVDVAGRRGSYLNFANVFRREGKPCSRCGTTIEKSRVAGRGTHTCPRCQKLKNSE